jgi:hypothetical protein
MSECLVVQTAQNGKLLEAFDGDLGAGAIVTGADALLLAPERGCTAF